jgi:hypothetical protein
LKVNSMEIVSFVISSSKFTNKEIFDEISFLLDAAHQNGFESEVIVISPVSQRIGDESFQTIKAETPLQFVIVGSNDSWDQQMFAGLTRANGDYVLIVGSPADEISRELNRMLSEMKHGEIDIVGLAIERDALFFEIFSRKRFLVKQLRKKFGEHVSLDTARDLLISRRALNWIIRDLPSSNSLFEIGFIPGLHFQVINSTNRLTRTSMNSELYFALLNRHTRFTLNSIRIGFALTFTVTFLTTINAIFVREFGRNVFGHVEIQIPGWTTIVFLLSFGFTTILYGIYLVLRSISSLREEMVQRPKYVIKSVNRI